MSFTTDNEKAFLDCYSVSGGIITIDGVSMKAILPFSQSVTQSFDSDGAFHGAGTDSVTVQTKDLPTITRDSIVMVNSKEHRIDSVEQNGTIGTTLFLEAP